MNVKNNHKCFNPNEQLSASISVIIPTYKEVENLPELIRQIECLRHQYCHLVIEVLIVDDDSNDGTEQLVELNQPWIRLIIRKENKGLSLAVIEGLTRAKHDIAIVMDADLSHPIEKIPEMICHLNQGADFVIGSRYVPGSSTDADWGLFRWLNSKIATLPARLLTQVGDPMSGFFALKRSDFEKSRHVLNPIGYKIGLELLVKCHCKRIIEIPIHFANRKHGKSKLSLKEQLHYIRHLYRLFIYYINKK